MSYPTLFGVLIGLLCAGVILFGGIWFPQYFETLGNHKTLVQGVYFTVFAFGAWLYGLWRWRHRPAFWASLSIFFLLHVLGVLFYTTQVGRILVWQWFVLLLLEAYVIAFFVGWSIQRFGHLDKADGPDAAKK
jgi:hypothetical protein